MTAKQLAKIKLLAMDVDGVLTDGGMVYAGDREQIKRFSVRDGLGMRLAMVSGLKIAWITGNMSPAVEARARDVGVTDLYQAARYKSEALRDLMRRHELSPEEVAYVGDDLNDLPAFEKAGVSFAVSDAAPEVKDAADFVTERAGGAGAVREVIEMILKGQNRWPEAVDSFLNELQREQTEGEVSKVVG